MKRNYTQLLCFIALTVVFAFKSHFSFAQTSDTSSKYRNVFDFQDDWYVYDEGFDSYVPFITERHFDIPAHVVFCNLEQNKGYKLLIRCEEEDNFLFIEGALKQKIPAKVTLALSIDSLYRIYNKEQIYLTIFGSKDIKTKWVGVGFEKSKMMTNLKKDSQDIFQVIPRKASPFRSPLSFFFLLVFGMFAYLSMSNVRVFTGFYNLRSAFITYSREQSLFASQALSRANVMFIILLSLILSLLYIILQSKGIDIFGKRWFLQEGETIGVLFSNYFRLCILFFVGFIVKYFFLGLLGRLFNVSKVVDLHFFKLLQTTLLYYSAFTLFVFSLTMNYIQLGSTLKEILVGTLILFYLGRTIIIFLTINRTLTIQLLYLISYLCIVELLPIIIGLRLVI